MARKSKTDLTASAFAPDNATGRVGKIFGISWAKSTYSIPCHYPRNTVGALPAKTGELSNDQSWPLQHGAPRRPSSESETDLERLTSRAIAGSLVEILGAHRGTLLNRRSSAMDQTRAQTTKTPIPPIAQGAGMLGGAAVLARTTSQ